MYFCVFPSCEYNTDWEENINIINDNDLCLICWLPKEKNNCVKLLTDFSNIQPSCYCKPKIHSLCLNDWIAKTKSCPICRKQINIITFSTSNQGFILNFYIIFVENSLNIVKILFYSSVINLFCLCFYNFYFLLNSFPQD